jgi:hypothetical protein
MGQRGIVDECHHRGDRHAVVCSECRSVGGQPFSVDDELDPALGRVVRAGRVAFAHHVQMALQDDGRRTLAAGGCRDADHHVPPLILLHVEAVLAGPAVDVLDRRLLLP